MLPILARGEILALHVDTDIRDESSRTCNRPVGKERIRLTFPQPILETTRDCIRVQPTRMDLSQITLPLVPQTRIEQRLQHLYHVGPPRDPIDPFFFQTPFREVLEATVRDRGEVEGTLVTGYRGEGDGSRREGRGEVSRGDEGR